MHTNDHGTEYHTKDAFWGGFQDHELPRFVPQRSVLLWAKLNWRYGANHRSVGRRSVSCLYQRCSRKGYYCWGWCFHHHCLLWQRPKVCNAWTLFSVQKGVCVGGKKQAFKIGTDSSIISTGAHDGDSTGSESVTIPQNVSTPRFSTAPHDEASTEDTGGLDRGDSCLGRWWSCGWWQHRYIRHLLRYPFTRMPTCQHMAFGDLSGHAPSMKVYLHRATPNLLSKDCQRHCRPGYALWCQ